MCIDCCFGNVGASVAIICGRYFGLTPLFVALRVHACRCAYNGINGSPMCMSPMIQDVLRAQFNFTSRPENYVVTDSGALDFMVSRFKRFPHAVDAAVAALHAGVDLNSGRVYSHELGAALKAGRVNMQMIDTALTRLFNARMSVGLFDEPSTIAYSKLGPDDIFQVPTDLLHWRCLAKLSYC